MRLLFLSNYYPPIANGGYEQLCQEISREFVRRGHQVAVLTSCSRNGFEAAVDEGVRVHQLLHLEVEGGLFSTTIRLIANRTRLERENLDQLRDLIDTFRPDVAMVWGMWNVPRSVPALVEELMPERVVYYLCDYWPSLPSAYLQQWQVGSTRTIARLPKRMLGNLIVAKLARDRQATLLLKHPVCVSRAVRNLLVQDGIPVAHASVIHNGIQVEEFRAATREWRAGSEGGLRLLYAGRLAREKGIDTAILALSHLDGGLDLRVTLDILGSGERSYERELKALVQKNRLERQAVFRGSVSRSEMPRTMRDYDALLFPSAWPEPLARIVMEAMAVGLVVIGTPTGGTGELLEDGVTGLTFKPGDAVELATQIRRLLDDRDLAARVATAARQRIEEQFTLRRMVDEIAALLQRVACEANVAKVLLGNVVQ